MVQIKGNLDTSRDPACSICIANYNGEDTLQACLESVIDQAGDFEIEILVHDDASTDSSSQILSNFESIDIQESTENVGFCKANNRMVERARGEFILLLNNDAILMDGALEALIEEARISEEDSILSLPQYDWKEGTLVDRGCKLDPFYNPVPILGGHSGDVAMVIGACLWIPRKVWLELGGFPEWMGSIAEDVHLCCAARQRGVPVKVLKSSGYRHWQGKAFGGNRARNGRLESTYRRRVLSERNKTCVMVIFTPTILLLPVLIFHIFFLILEGLLLTVSRKDFGIVRKIYLPALRDVMKNRKNLIEVRRKMQKARTVSIVHYFSAFTLVPRKLILLLQYGIPSLK